MVYILLIDRIATDSISSVVAVGAYNI